MRKVIFRTFVFKGGDVLRKAADSIINQTYENFVWYVIDFSKNKRNLDILNEFKDERIVWVDLSDEFDVKSALPTTYLNEILQKYDEDDYFVSLDVDDSYSREFSEKMIEFMIQNDLEVAACGSLFVGENQDRVLGERCLKDRVILESKSDYARMFQYIYAYLRTVWGKMYKVSCLLKCDFKDDKQIYGNDTLFVFETVVNSNKVGIINESLHNYSTGVESVSYKFDPIRVFSDRILLKRGKEFVIKKCGFISTLNDEFLYVIYMNAIFETKNVILNSNISDDERIHAFYELVLNDDTFKMASIRGFGYFLAPPRAMLEIRMEFFCDIYNWIIQLKTVNDNLIDEYARLGEYVSAFVENAESWIYFKRTMLENLINTKNKIEAKRKLEELHGICSRDEIYEYECRIRQI